MGNVKFTNDDVVAVYRRAMDLGYVQKEVASPSGAPADGCTVLDGLGLFNLAASYSGAKIRAKSYRHESADYEIIPTAEEEILELKRAGYTGSHFVCGNGIAKSGRWQNEIEFDPIEGGSQCARSGWIASKRIIEF